MADPVSTMANIIAVLQISVTVIRTSYQYLDSIKNGPKDMRRIVEELNNLNSVLWALGDLTRSGITSDLRLSAVEKLLNSSDSPLQKCQTELQALHSTLSEPVTGLRGLGKRLVWPLKEKETQKALDTIRAQKATCNLALNVDSTALSVAIQEDIRALGDSFAAIKTDDQNKKIIQWYSTVSPYTNHLAALEKREPTTGEWFLRGAEFAAWLRTPKSFLWLHGIPGCGKTVLSSTIIEKVLSDYGNEPKTAIAYFYFDFAESEKQGIKCCLSSLIAQICRQRLHIPDAVQSLYKRQLPFSSRPSTGQLLNADLLRAFSAATEGLEVFLICDALDECGERDILMDILSTIPSRNYGNIKTLVTSRSEHDIEVALAPILRGTNNVCIQDAKIEADIRLFVSSSIAEGPKTRKWPITLKAEVKSALVQGAKGMFRWVKCQLDVLHRCTTVQDVRKALTMLPPTLDETYERILLSIDRDQWEKAHTALQWLIFSARPLRLQELAEAVVMDPKSDSFSPEERMFDPDDIVSICRSLVSKDTSELKLAHYSVQEYLVSERIRQGPASFFSVIEVRAEALIAEVCLAYILLFDKPNSLSDNALLEWPLLDYACKHWFHHVRKLGDEPVHCNATRLAEKLFINNQSCSFFNWLRVFQPDRSWIGFTPHANSSSFASPLYYASFCGLLSVARSLVARGSVVAELGGFFMSPLNAATMAGNNAVARFLIHSKADVNIKDDRMVAPLHNACLYNDPELVRLLLQAGAAIEANDWAGGTAMHFAGFYGYTSTIQVLDEYNAEIDARAPFTRDDLEPGSTNEAKWSIKRTPLMEAAWSGEEETVRLLLDLGADVNAVDGHGMTALIRAARCGHRKTVKILLSRGANALIKDKNEQTADDWLKKYVR